MKIEESKCFQCIKEMQLKKIQQIVNSKVTINMDFMQGLMKVKNGHIFIGHPVCTLRSINQLDMKKCNFSRLLSLLVILFWTKLMTSISKTCHRNGSEQVQIALDLFYALANSKRERSNLIRSKPVWLR